MIVLLVQVTLGGHFELKNEDAKRYAMLPTFVMLYQSSLSYQAARRTDSSCCTLWRD